MPMFFSQFPTVNYKISDFNTVQMTNLLFKTKFLQPILNNTTLYYNYYITEADKPEILAYKIYGNAEYHWIILYVNQIIDPDYDWPLSYRDFNNYIVNKYGSLATAKTTIHHYEYIVKSVDSRTGIETIDTYVTDATDPRESAGENLPYNPYDELTVEYGDGEQYTFSNGLGVTVFTKRNEITCYDFEEELNEKRRNIRLLKPEFLEQVLAEFRNHARVASAQENRFPFIRGFRR